MVVRKRPPGSPASGRPASHPPAKAMADRERVVVGAASPSTQWILFAVASGACAAFNGVFAKLTTTGLTTTLARTLAGWLGMSALEHLVEYAVRGIFFALNLTFNGIMWTLFTTALARGTSTTQVSILNTSTNFVFTALLGLLIFSESLPPLWWAGASLLVAGSVIVGRKDETRDLEGGYAPIAPQGEHDLRRRTSDDEADDEDVIDLGSVTGERR